MNNGFQHPTTRISRPLRATAPRKTLMASMLIGSLLVASGCDATATSAETAAGDSTAQGSVAAATQTATATATAITTRDELASATHYDSDDLEYDSSQVTTVELATTTATVTGADTQDVSVSTENGETALTISGSGVYRLSGTLAGQVVVASDDEAAVQLILDNADISSAVGPALLITAADEVTVIVADGTTNSLADAASRTDDESDPNYDTNAALFSRSDLTLAGTGTLQVTGNLEDGIHSKDGLVTVTRSNEGIEAASITIIDGIIDVTSADDAINASGGYGTESTSDDTGAATTGMAESNRERPTPPDGNGALDVAGTFEVTGGTLTAVGSAGMAQSPDTGSAQASVSFTLTSQLATGATVAIADADGNVLATLTLAKSAAHIVFSAADLVTGKTYEAHQVASSSQDTVEDATLLGSATAA